jgi:hypothetical protein
VAHRERSRTHGFARLVEVSQFAEKDVDEDAEVVGIKELRYPGGREDEIEQLQHQHLHASVFGASVCDEFSRWFRQLEDQRTAGAVQHEDQVLAEGSARIHAADEQFKHPVSGVFGRDFLRRRQRKL